METNMVQTGLPTGGSMVPDAVFPGAGKVDIPALPKTEAAQPTQKAQPKEQVAFDAAGSEQTRLENMQRASQLMYSEVFAVRDNKFSIYKDATGQFVTRFTNLRDGSVTYIPEPDMMAYLESRGRHRKALLNIDV